MTADHSPTSNQENPTMSPFHDDLSNVTLAGTSRIPHGDRERPAPAPVAPTRRYPVATGELRSRLQPVLFMTLNEPQAGHPAGTLIGVQFWAPGRVAITAPGSRPVLVEDYEVEARWYGSNTDQTVTTAELRARLQPIVLAYLVEQVTDNSNGSTVEAGERVAAQFHGGGMCAVTNLRTGDQVVVRTNTIHVAWNWQLGQVGPDDRP
jgi:hypothetical protein